MAEADPSWPDTETATAGQVLRSTGSDPTDRSTFPTESWTTGLSRL